MKRLTPMICLLLVVVLAGGGMLALGSLGLRHPDHNPGMLRSGGLLAYLRDGQSFSLDQVYPESWDTAQFAADSWALPAWELQKLFRYDPALAQSNAPLLLLWQEDELLEALSLGWETAGYPRFISGFDTLNFSVSRSMARFTCTFVTDDSGSNGYYRCSPEGEAI